MPTKTKKTPNKWRGRPKKEFKIKKTNEDTKIKRGRGRPKKEKIRKTDSINSKISKYKKDLKKISKKHEKIHKTIKNTTFSNKKINKEDKKTDRFALWLLIFSMLFFIFALYKTFLFDSTDYQNTDIISFSGDTTLEVWLPKEQDTIESTWALEVEEVKEVERIEEVEEEIKNVETANSNVLQDFYQNINDKKYQELKNMVDNYLKSSSVFNTYYNQRWLNNFITNVSNEKIYLTNLEEIKEKSKEWVKYFGYTIKYKLKNQNEMFEEQREAAIIDRNDKELIGSLRCTNTGCSKMPFFNPQIHGIQ